MQHSQRQDAAQHRAKHNVAQQCRTWPATKSSRAYTTNREIFSEQTMKLNDTEFIVTCTATVSEQRKLIDPNF